MRMMDTAPLVLHGAAVYPWSPALEERFTLEDRFEGEYPLFLKQGDELWLPRRIAGPSDENTLDLRTAGLPANFKDLYTANHDDQERVMAETRQLLALGVSHIVQAPTGYGKTYVGCGMAAAVNRYTLVLTTKEDLIGQWRAAARNVLGLTDDQIGEWRGDVVPQPGQQFVIALVQSVLKGPERYPSWMFEQFGFVLCDEVHRMGADGFAQAMWWLPARLRAGLSATPYRKDGKDLVFQAHIGDIKVIGVKETLIPKVIMEHTGWKAPRKIVRDPKTKKDRMVLVPHAPGRTMHIVKAMAKDKGRNIKIAKFVRLAYEKGRLTVVFADTMDHLHAMRDVCIAAGVKEADTGYYVGLESGVYTGKKAEKEAQREAVKHKRVMFATYKMFSEGTDIPWLDTCVLGSPRGDVNQIVGRIRRIHPGKKEPLVFDPVDNDSPVFKSYANARLKWYKSLGAKVVVYR